MIHRVLTCSAVLSAFASAQESRGGVTGRVLNSQDTTVPGATVVVTNTETSATYRTTTNVTGYHEVNLLHPGMYSVTVESTGFKKIVRQGIKLNVGARLDFEFRLEAGQLAETIVVTAAAPLLG